MPRRHLIVLLALAFGALWVALAIDPVDRADWALENVLIAAGIGFLVAPKASLSENPLTPRKASSQGTSE